jgi:putative N6-adenine-specific DNA methylase
VGHKPERTHFKIVKETHLFAVSTPGLEPLLTRELRALGLTPASPASSLTPVEKEYETGGVAFQGSLTDLYFANLHLRTASRILVRLGSFQASRFPELIRKAADLPWEKYLSPGTPVALRVTCRSSRLYHQRAVAERVARAIGDRLGRIPPLQKFDDEGRGSLPQLVLVRMVEDRCTISVDSSGELLHRRGYRLATAKAPLRETLAAAMLLASGWDAGSPLIDPFCGSGTIPIEAVWLARGIPPGSQRSFAFMDWPTFDTTLWHALRDNPPAPKGGPAPRIFASDRDAGAIRAARGNAARAGVADGIDFSCRAVSSIDPLAGPGWIVTNPPFGKRLSSNRDLRNLYAQMGKTFRSKCPGWRVAMLCDSGRLVRSTGLKFDHGFSTTNGGLKVNIFVGWID